MFKRAARAAVRKARTYEYLHTAMSPTAFPIIATADKPLLHRDDFWLPESPVHDEATGITYFTDIPSKVLHFCFSPLHPLKADIYVLGSL